MATQDAPLGYGGMKVIHAGLFRMATKSMAEAYRILGYKTHHGLDDVLGNPWPLIEQAAEAKWPHVPEARPRAPFTSADWAAIWGDYDIATDLASPFVEELIQAYPEAKVVVVQRDFDSWWPSFKSELLDTLYRPTAPIQLFVAWNIMGIRAGHAMKKVHFGFFNAKNKAEIEDHAREAYEEYYARIRRIVPPERRLEYKIGSGWEPLCQFLGKEVPETKFPRANDRKAHAEGVEARHRMMWNGAAKRVAPVLVAVGAIVAAWWYARSLDDV
jgi:hypothetical protein